MQLSELLIRAFKDQKCPQWPNVLGLTLCARRRIQTQPKNTSSSLLCPNLEKPRGSSKNCHNPVSFTRKKNRSDLDCHHLETWTRGVSHEKQVSDLYERDWLQSTCWLFIIKTWLRFKLHCRQNDRHTVTNLKSVNDNQAVSQKQMKPVSVALFYICSLFFPQSCRIA